MFFQSKNQHAAKKAICWTSKYFWNHRIVQPIVRKNIVIAWIQSEKNNLEFNLWIVLVENICFFKEVPTLDTFLTYLLWRMKLNITIAVVTNIMFAYVFIFVMLLFWWLKGTLLGFAHVHLNTNVANAKNDCTAIIIRENVKFTGIGGSSSLHCS